MKTCGWFSGLIIDKFMLYLNPFELLQTFAGDGGEWLDFDEKSLRRARRRVVAEADLEGTLQLNKTGLSKNEIAAVLDELDDAARFKNHRIIYETKLLLKFLNNGDSGIFDLEDEFEIYDYCADFDLIAASFATRFDKLFAASFHKNDARQIELMSRFLIFVHDEHLDICFKSVEKTFANQLVEYETLLSEVKKKDFNAADSRTMLTQINAAVNVKTLNALPDYFDLRCDRLADSIDQIAVYLHNNYNETEIASTLNKIAVAIKANSLTRARIEQNKGVLENEVSQLEFTKRLKKIERVAAIADQLKQFAKELNGRFALGAKDNKFRLR